MTSSVARKKAEERVEKRKLTIKKRVGDIRGEERIAQDGHTKPERGWGRQRRSLSAACSSDNPCAHLVCPRPGASAPGWLPSAPQPLLPHCQLLFLASFSFLPARAEGKQLPSQCLPQPWRLGLPVVMGMSRGSGDRQAGALLSDLKQVG